MDGWWNAKRHLLAVTLFAGSTLVFVGRAHADILTTNAPAACTAGSPGRGTPAFSPVATTPPVARTVAPVNVKAVVRTLGESLAAWREDLGARAGGDAINAGRRSCHQAADQHDAPAAPAATTAGRWRCSAAAGQRHAAAAATDHAAAAAERHRGSARRPRAAAADRAEPASLVTALLGAGLASLAAWRQRRRKRHEV